MLRRLFTASLYALLLSTLVMFLCWPVMTNAYALTSSKSVLRLNLEQGPLGVTLTLKGANFQPGTAQLSYIDSQNTPGTFGAPSDSSVQVKDNGTFTSTNVILPGNGPVGTWKILVTDSSGMAVAASYAVLAAPGQQMSGVPSLTINPSSGASGDAIVVNGSNWLPGGTSVNLTLRAGSSAKPLIKLTSDSNGAITGSFHLPSNLNNGQATIYAADTTGSLKAQTSILITASAPTASPSPQGSVTPTTTPSATTTATAEASPSSTVSQGIAPPDDSSGPGRSVSNLNPAILGPLLLLVGGVLGIAALMMVLFLLPWENKKMNRPPSGQY